MPLLEGSSLTYICSLHPVDRVLNFGQHTAALSGHNEDISSIRPTGRDWFVPNVRGGYIHYESRAANEAATQSPSIQAPELSTCSTATTPTTSDTPAPLPAASGQNNEVVATKALPDNSLLMSGALQSEVDTTETVVVISSPTQLKRSSTTSKKQKEKKKHGKKMEVDKRKQVSNKAKGHIVTLEITSGQTYRGKLLDAEDNMNVQLKDITVTARDGRVSHLDQVYIRGSHVRFFIVPDMLRNAPMFRSRNVRGRGVGLARGRATVSRARAGGRGGR
ncbi:hypothetical protein HYE68_010052 [Fusarium pseudograminearum]|nr:hypothetical protein HYE68_010052 [Fusarium pseudograminearum]